MKTWKQIVVVLVLNVLLIPCVSKAQNSSIVISEILFNPEGSDTGSEYIVLKNISNETVSLEGFTLYPDGVGYFVFSQKSLAVGTSIKVHINASGSDDNRDAYHSSASGNMGNTSGSIALFSSAERGSDTMIDFVQYGRSGETWESSAEQAGLWHKGDFLQISPDEEGVVLRRTNDQHGITSWNVEHNQDSTSNISHEGATQEQSSEVRTTSDNTKVYSGPSNIQSLKAFAGEDRKTIAGTDTIFEGKLIGYTNTPITDPNARFLWNFGDGFIEEGKKKSHVYEYPGTYIANLQVALGEDSYSDYVTVVVNENSVTIQDIETGSDGWIQLSNPAPYPVIIDGWTVRVGGVSFQFPRGTSLAAKSSPKYASRATKLIFNKNDLVELIYPNGKISQRFVVGSGKVETTGVSEREEVTPKVSLNNNIKLASIVHELPSQEPQNTLDFLKEEKREDEKPSMYASLFQGIIKNTYFTLFLSIGVGLVFGMIILLVYRKTA